MEVNTEYHTRYNEAEGRNLETKRAEKGWEEWKQDQRARSLGDTEKQLLNVFHHLPRDALKREKERTSHFLSLQPASTLLFG